MSSRQRRDGGPREDTPPPRPDPLSVEALDSHCHLDLMDVDVAGAVRAAQAVGVRRMLTIGIDVASSQWCAQTAAEHADVWAGVAIHPNEAHRADEAAWAEIGRLAGLPQVRAVGETGLDYYRDTAPPDRQQESFRRHIAIAKATGTALMIHDRNAHDDVLRLLEEEGAPEHVVFHCFSGDAAMAKVCADRGYAMSFAGNVTFRNAQPLREAAAAAPLELLLVETDAPFLTPAPYRGHPNAPYLIPLTVRALAEVKGVDADTVAAAVTATARRVFGPWPEEPAKAG
ncbi:MAG: TatD family hydrolase [Actinomycetota bacterium]|nr:TatD family hydrolase [Actinomycetota bacterium]